eukprot:TRINITY_DN3719_c0_g1_i1.p1 TRINITY_DN3719_c0_g1~~TRINITY_DN3719_c0_g1_i1.p1  ORF type:complete len:816 (-),score=327.85 TRINITY_DN3719_c0_g1_i1:22-2469(-)
MSGRGGRLNKEGRGEFVRKKERSNRDEADLFAVTEKDIQNELEAIVKHTQRIEKNIQRLTEEEKNLIDEEDKWALELDKLEQTARTTIERLEEKTRKEQFEWTREQKIEETKLERLLQRLDNLENELDTKTDKREEKERIVLDQLNEELSNLEKGGNDSLSHLRRLQEEFQKLEESSKKLEEKSSQLTREKTKVEKLLALEKAQREDFEKQLTEASAKDDGSKKELAERDDLENSILQMQKDLKNLDKAASRNKEEQAEMDKLRAQIQETKQRNETLVQELEKVEADLKEAKSAAKQAATGGSPSETRREDGTKRKKYDTDAVEEGEEAKSEGQKQIEELEREVKRLEFEWTETKTDLEYALTDLQNAEANVKSKVDRLKEEILVLDKELSTQRDNYVKDDREKKEALRRLEEEAKNDAREIDKITKDLSKLCTKDLTSAKTTLQTRESELQVILQNIETLNFVCEFLSASETRIEKETKEINDKIERVKVTTKNTEENLKLARENLAEVNDEIREFVKKHEAIIQKFEEELYKEMNTCDALVKRRDNLRLEIRRMRAYMKKDKHVVGDEGESSAEAAAKEEAFIAKLVEDRKNELNKIKSQLHQARPKENKTLAELTEEFQKLIAEDKERWEDIKDFIYDFHQCLKQLQVKQIVIYQALVDLLSTKVHEGVIIALTEMLQRQIEGDIKSPIATAQHLMWLAKRDVKLGLVDDEMFEMRKRKHDKFSEALLRRLAIERNQRTKKLISYCELVILEGGEEWPENEYLEFEAEEQLLEQEEVKAREEEKKKIAEEKAFWKKKREERTGAQTQQKTRR